MDFQTFAFNKLIADKAQEGEEAVEPVEVEETEDKEETPNEEVAVKKTVKRTRRK